MNIGRRFAIALSMALGLVAGSAALTQAGATMTQTVLYDFCPTAACSTGSNPQAQLLKVGSVLYGVAITKGKNHLGTAFQYDLSTSIFKVLHQFCKNLVMGVCTDGSSPNTRLIADVNGNLYGTTYGGGISEGTVFELVKPTGTGNWKLVTIYNFCSSMSGGLCLDGSNPETGLTYQGQSAGAPYDGTSLLYGTTTLGGSGTGNSGNGVVYALKPGATSWSQKVIHVFCAGCSTPCTPCTDGTGPFGQIELDANNRLVGTAGAGGSNNGGIVWSLTPGTDLWNDPWSETVLYNFCWGGSFPCTDGLIPTGVLLDASGNIFGTTVAGGSGIKDIGNGVLFKLTAGTSCTEGGTATFLCETVEHSFCNTTCADGSGPNGDLVMNATGRIFGTTIGGGSGGVGVAFRAFGTTYTTTYTFCPSGGTNCPDGVTPTAGLLFNSSGTLYGTTAQGGNSFPNDNGVIFELQ